MNYSTTRFNVTNVSYLGIFCFACWIFAYHIKKYENFKEQTFGSLASSQEEPSVYLRQKLGQETKFLSLTDRNTQLQNVFQAFDINKTRQELHTLCPGNQDIDKLTNSYAGNENTAIYENILLIIVALYEDYQDVFKIHNVLYRKTFPKMVFCGPTKKASLGSSYPFVFFTEVTKDKELFYTCMNEVIDKYSDPSIDGYLLLSDDLLFFHWNLDFSSEKLSKIWLRESQLNTYDLVTNCHTEGGLSTATNCAPSGWTPLMPHRQDRIWAKTALKQLRDSNISALSNCFNTLAKKNGGEFRVNYDWFMGDMFYIPSSIKKEYLVISDTFARNNLIHALAVPTIAKCFEDTNGIYLLSGINDPSTRPLLKSRPTQVINAAIKNRKPFVHPVKFSGIINGKNQGGRQYFCSTLLPLFYSK